MTKDYTPEQRWSLYSNLPKDLKEAVFSAGVAQKIFDICKKNKISEEKTSITAKIIGDLLLGILQLKDFQKTLEKELKLEKETAEKISQEVNQLIFDPVKDSLTEISNEKTLPKKEIKPEDLRKPAYPEGGDTYREPVE